MNIKVGKKDAGILVPPVKRFYYSEEGSKWKHVKHHIKHVIYECRESLKSRYFLENVFYRFFSNLKSYLEEGWIFFPLLWSSFNLYMLQSIIDAPMQRHKLEYKVCLIYTHEIYVHCEIKNNNCEFLKLYRNIFRKSCLQY